ncbi:hypothetical protein [Novosphingobium sp.]
MGLGFIGMAVARRRRR